jgi:hypothetical protein
MSVLLRAVIVIALICLYSPLRTGGGGMWVGGSWSAAGEPAKPSDLSLSDEARRELARIAEREARNGIAKKLAQSGLRGILEPPAKGGDTAAVDPPRF